MRGLHARALDRLALARRETERIALSIGPIPVSVASSTCYAQDLTVPVGGTRPQDGAQAFNMVHVYDDTVVHSVVPVEAPKTLEYIDAAEAQRRLADAGVQQLSATRRIAPPTEPIPVLR